jgi:hypothetical protein
VTAPFLQRPGERSVEVAWITAFEGRRHLVLYGADVGRLDAKVLERIAAEGQAAIPDGRTVHIAEASSRRLSRMREDADSHLPPEWRGEPPEGPGAMPIARALWRQTAEATGLRPGERVPYRVLSVDERGNWRASATYTLGPKPPPGQGVKILLTSDHQNLPMTPANLQMVEETIGQVDAVFVVGDLVNHPDRASQWFDDARGSAFFPSLQGRASRVIAAADGTPHRYRGGRLIQYAPLYTVVGNHEVMGPAAPGRGIAAELSAAVPRAVAARAYAEVAATVNPTQDPRVRDRWIKDNSFNVDTYLELFGPPHGALEQPTYWAESFSDIRVIGLSVTQIWRTPNLDADRPGRYHEPERVLDDPLEQGWGQHIVEPIERGSAQFAWLERELASTAFKASRYRIVLMHHAIHGIGANVSPPFTDPVRLETRDADGRLTAVRYTYPRGQDHLVRDLAPLLREAGVQLVVNGHSHLWNRFYDRGMHLLETSNVGNSFGAFHPASGRSRLVPPAPWDPADVVAQGDPNGLEPIAPNIRPLVGPDGAPLPFIAEDHLTVFSILDTHDGTVSSYAFDVYEPASGVVLVDRFTIGE